MNGWDITTINPNDLPDFDIFTHGSPCTSFSMAGKRDGADKNSGTASSLIWYSVEIIRHKLPKYVLWENVPDVLSDKHRHNFDEYINELNGLGYNSYYKIMVATDFGIPQKRKRIYVVSIRKDVDNGNFHFIDGLNDIITLNDVLEDDAEPPIYSNIYGGFGESKPRVHNEYSPTIRTAKGGGHIPSVKLKDILDNNVDNKYYVSEKCLNGIKNSNFAQKTQQIQDIDKPCATILARDYKDPKIVNQDGYRKLTPLKCFRLMDETDENFYKVKNALIEKFYKGKDRADSQLYKIAGNSIVKRVLKSYIKILLKDYINQD
jgi:DNA (cytosine-5)-methyltransferase 1